MLKTKFNYQWGYLVCAKERMSLQMATIQLHTITTTGQSLNSGETTGINPFGTTCMVLGNRPAVIANVPAFYNHCLPTYNARLGRIFLKRIWLL